MANETPESRIKTCIELIVLSTTAFLFIWLIFSPKSLNNWCDRGGFSECIFFGAKYEPTREQKRAMRSMEVISLESEERFNNLVDEIQGIKEQIPTAGLSRLERGVLTSKLASVEAVAISSKKNISEGLQLFSPVVDELAPEGTWVIVFGGDKTFESAKQELQRVKGYPTAQIVYRNGMYRSVVVFSNRDEAQQNLPDIRAASFKKDAYIVSFESWCDDKKTVSNASGTYIECMTKR